MMQMVNSRMVNKEKYDTETRKKSAFYQLPAFIIETLSGLNQCASRLIEAQDYNHGSGKYNVHGAMTKKGSGEKCR